jgi:hypothetical protein
MDSATPSRARSSRAKVRLNSPATVADCCSEAPRSSRTTPIEPTSRIAAASSAMASDNRQVIDRGRTPKSSGMEEH